MKVLTDGDTWTKSVAQTSVDGSGVVGGLSGQLGWGSIIVGINLDPNIKLGQGDLETKIGELLHGSGNVLRGGSSDEMGFES